MAPIVVRQAASKGTSGGTRTARLRGMKFDFAMIGKSGSGAGYAIARLEFGYSFAHGQYDSRAAVSQAGKRVQPVLYFLVGARNTFFPGNGEDFAHYVGAGQRFAQQALLSSFQFCQFGTRTYGRKVGLHQYSFGRSSGGELPPDEADPIDYRAVVLS